MSTKAISPTVKAERIQSLDILRGVAILGILIMNIQSFAMPGAAYLNPTVYGSLEGSDYWIWIFSHLFADQKFMTLFSLLFGAGILLVSRRMEETSGSSVKFHFKRNFWLLVIGLTHAYLIWYGDILVTYALCSFLVFWLRNNSPRTLVIIGLLVLSVPSLLYLFFSASLPMMPEQELTELRLDWHPNSEMITQEITEVTGSLGEQLSHNIQAALEMQTFVFFILFFWRASGLMLIGMALHKWGILSASRPNAFYWKGMLSSFAIGIPLTIYGIVQNFDAGWTMEYSMFTGSSFNYWGSLATSFGYICAVMLFSKSSVATVFKARLAAIGQMALTNYISQSLIGVGIFFGVGFGLFGEVSRTYQLFITLCIWALQFAWSKPWLEAFRFGPLEWLWRSLSYMKFQPMKKS